MKFSAQQIDGRRLMDQGIVADVERHEVLDSTQDRAHAIATAEPTRPLPILVVAREQTKGRGRGANRWWTGAGSLAFSLLFDPRAWGLAREALPQRSLAAAVAIIDSVAPWLIHHQVGLHWPNDVYANGRKLAGILIDVLPDGRHVLGIGLNTNNSFADAPDDVRAKGASLAELTGIEFDHTTVLVALLERLRDTLRQSADEPERLGRRFHDLCLQAGRELTIDVHGELTTGRCLGIQTDGALLLETRAGRQKFYSGALR